MTDTRSDGDNSTESPRRPPETSTRGCPSTDSSMHVGSRFFCPKGEIPPTMYPVERSAAAGSAMVAFFAPIADAKALRLSWPLTGTTATASFPEGASSTMRVLSMMSGSKPSFAAPSSPKWWFDGSWS